MKRSETEVRLRNMKWWYPEGFDVHRYGKCDVCRHYSGRGLGEITNGNGEDQIDQRGRQVWATLCPECWCKWKRMNREHLVAWELMK